MRTAKRALQFTVCAAVCCLTLTLLPSAVRPLTAQQVAAAGGQSPTGVLIRGGMVVDGSGSAQVRGDVRVRGDQIVEMAPSLTPVAGERVIDGTGLVVSPGFIDIHSHANGGLERSPTAESQIRQGITTAIVGQDGGSSLPVASFLEEVDRLHPLINYATMIGHGTVRSAVMGGDFRRPATAEEVRTMGRLVNRGMLDGAVGLSSGTEYDPGFFAQPSELEALARVVKPYGGFYASHVRDEENGVLDAFREVIDVGRKTDVPVHISHIKLASKPVWGKAREALALLDNAVAEGVDVTADWYPYSYWSSSMYVLIPDRDFENRQKWEVGLDEIGGADHVLVTGYRPDSSLNGMTVAEIARKWGKDPVTTIIEMMRTAGPNIGIIATAMDEADMDILAAYPRVVISSDGGLAGAHPRGYGSFPRVLGVYVREKKVLTLPDAIRKMTSATASLLGLTDRGLIAPGRKADIVLFDPATIADRGTKTKPDVTPVGIRYVLVNGEVVIDDGRISEARPGKAIRRGNWKAYADPPIR